MYVIVDTREKKPLNFNFELIKGTIPQKLDTGDYTIKGFEDMLCVERKQSVTEIAINFTEQRFTRELERMSKFPYSFLLCEFSMDDVRMYPVGSDIPRDKWPSIRIRGPYLVRRFVEMAMQYKVVPLFCGSREGVEAVAYSIFKRVVHA